MEQSFLSFYECLTRQATGNVHKRNLVDESDRISESNDSYISVIYRLVGDLSAILNHESDIDPSIKVPFQQAIHLFYQQLQDAEKEKLHQRLATAKRPASYQAPKQLPSNSTTIIRPPSRQR